MDLSGYRESIDSADAAAFDIFDTLTVRPFFRPRDLFYFLEAESGLEGFHDARIEAERSARRAEFEPDIDRIYGFLDPKYSSLKDIEIESEIEFSRPDPDGVSLFRYALEQGKKTVLVSDMYLGKGIIEKILERNGISGYSALYVSSDLKASKRAGSLYGKVLEDLGLDGKDVLMIGDNPRSDLAQARSSGLCAVRWMPLRERYGECHPHETKYVRKHPGLGPSVIVGMDILQWSSGREESYWHAAARRFGGPMNVMFAEFVKRNSEDADGLVFFSRDGYMPMETYRILGGRKPSVYLHTSRAVAKVFGARDLSDRDTVLSLMGYLRRSGRYPGLEVPGKSEYREFVAENREFLEKVVDDGHARFAGYVNKMLEGMERPMMVDATTMKFTSQKDVEGYLGHKAKGCYYAVMRDSPEDHAAYCDRTHQFLSSSYVNLAEFFMGSGENTVLDIGDGGEPVLAEDVSPDEEIRMEAFPEIYGGIMECAGFYKGMFGDRIPLIPGEDMDGWTDVLMAEDRGELSEIKWAVNTQHTIFRHLILRFSDLPGLVLMKAAELFSDNRKKL